MAFNSATQTKKDYAERPFSLRHLVNTQFTIEEKLDISAKPRTTRKEGISKLQKAYSFDIAKIKISDGLFSKDLELNESEWTSMCTALPQGLINLLGVTLKVGRDASGLGFKFEYIGIARQDMNGNQYNSGNIGKASGAIAASMEPTPTQPQDVTTEIGNQIKQLHKALELNQEMKISNTAKEVIAIADKIRPGDALGIIKGAKEQGWITEQANGTFRAE